MHIRKKRILKKPIVFNYRSLNPFASLIKDECNNLNKVKVELLNEENEWRLEYELIYRSYQLEQ